MVVLFIALGILRGELRNKNSVELNLKALTIHCIAFFLLAVVSLLFIIQLLRTSVHQNPKNELELIYVGIAGMLLNCLSGFILMYIFIKIYSVVKKASNQENPKLLENTRDSSSSLNSYIHTSPKYTTLKNSEEQDATDIEITEID